MEKTQELINKAQLIILVLDASREVNEEEDRLIKSLQDKDYIVVANKSDLNPNSKIGLRISAINGDIQALLKELKARYDSDLLINSPTLESHRQLGLMKQANQSLLSAIKAIANDQELDLVIIDLNQAYQYLSDILGRHNRMDLLDSIFRNFCLGK
jgi:tRNA modification GTPase